MKQQDVEKTNNDPLKKNSFVGLDKDQLSAADSRKGKELVGPGDNDHCRKLDDGGEFYIGKTPPIQFFQDQHGTGPSGVFSK